MPKPVVTGITALGLDHVSTLGTTIKEIAWYKAGIYKVGLRLLATILVINPVRQEGVPALTVEQPEEAMAVLKQVAEEVKVGSTWNSPKKPPPDSPQGFQLLRGRTNTRNGRGKTR